MKFCWNLLLAFISSCSFQVTISKYVIERKISTIEWDGCLYKRFNILDTDSMACKNCTISGTTFSKDEFTLSQRYRNCTKECFRPTMCTEYKYKLDRKDPNTEWAPRCYQCEHGTNENLIFHVVYAHEICSEQCQACADKADLATALYCAKDCGGKPTFCYPPRTTKFGKRICYQSARFYGCHFLAVPRESISRACKFCAMQMTQETSQDCASNCDGYPTFQDKTRLVKKRSPIMQCKLDAYGEEILPYKIPKSIKRFLNYRQKSIENVAYAAVQQYKQVNGKRLDLSEIRVDTPVVPAKPVKPKPKPIVKPRPRPVISKKLTTPAPIPETTTASATTHVDTQTTKTGENFLTTSPSINYKTTMSLLAITTRSPDRISSENSLVEQKTTEIVKTSTLQLEKQIIYPATASNNGEKSTGSHFNTESTQMATGISTLNIEATSNGVKMTTEPNHKIVGESTIWTERESTTTLKESTTEVFITSQKVDTTTEESIERNSNEIITIESSELKESTTIENTQRNESTTVESTERNESTAVESTSSSINTTDADYNFATEKIAVKAWGTSTTEKLESVTQGESKESTNATEVHGEGTTESSSVSEIKIFSEKPTSTTTSKAQNDVHESFNGKSSTTEVGESITKITQQSVTTDIPESEHDFEHSSTLKHFKTEENGENVTNNMPSIQGKSLYELQQSKELDVTTENLNTFSDYGSVEVENSTLKSENEVTERSLKLLTSSDDTHHAISTGLKGEYQVTTNKFSTMGVTNEESTTESIQEVRDFKSTTAYPSTTNYAREKNSTDENILETSTVNAISKTESGDHAILIKIKSHTEKTSTPVSKRPSSTTQINQGVEYNDNETNDNAEKLFNVDATEIATETVDEEIFSTTDTLQSFDRNEPSMTSTVTENQRESKSPIEVWETSTIIVNETVNGTTNVSYTLTSLVSQVTPMYSTSTYSTNEGIHFTIGSSNNLTIQEPKVSEDFFSFSTTTETFVDYEDPEEVKLTGIDLDYLDDEIESEEFMEQLEEDKLVVVEPKKSEMVMLFDLNKLNDE